MMTQHQSLCDFIINLPEHVGHSSEHVLELCINGDFIDFLAIPKWQSWTADPNEAVQKLRLTASTEPFGKVFTALSRHVGCGHLLSIILGNHDTELIFPQVQDELISSLKTEPHKVRIIDDGSAYQIGGVLIEHGNRYDGANTNDWDGLRAYKSAASRYESLEFGRKLSIPAGSELVNCFLNPLRAEYPFLDLLKPEGELLALLLLVLEPRRIHKQHLASLWASIQRQKEALPGKRPRYTRNISALTHGDLSTELREVLQEELEELSQSRRAIAATSKDKAYILAQYAMTGLAAQIRSWHDNYRQFGEPLALPPDRLRKIHSIMRNILVDTTIFAKNGDLGPCGLAASDQCTQSLGEVETVIMGHTHLARHAGPSNKAFYINTGTWADLMTIPKKLLAPWDENSMEQQRYLQDYLVKLVLEPDALRMHHLTYADVFIDKNGQIQHAKLQTYRSTMQELVDVQTAAAGLLADVPHGMLR